MDSDLLNEIYLDYKDELGKAGLREQKATDMFNTIKKSQRHSTIIRTTINNDDSRTEEVTEKNKGRSDWLKQNPIMAKAAKKHGITKSSELRELIYRYWEEQ